MHSLARITALFFAPVLVLPLFSSCGLTAAAGRTMSSLLQVSATPEDETAREAAFAGLREIHEQHDLTPPAAGSTR
jgi:hypothetical protein